MTDVGVRLNAEMNLRNTQKNKNQRRTFVQNANLNNFDPKEKALLQLGASQIIQIAKTGQFNPVSLVNQLTSLGFNQY